VGRRRPLQQGDGASDPWLDEDIQPLALTEPEIEDLVAFLASLTSPQYKKLGDQEYARQLALSKVSRPQRAAGIRREAIAASAASVLS
jgi:cytochrome c peroxidase